MIGARSLRNYLQLRENKIDFFQKIPLKLIYLFDSLRFRFNFQNLIYNIIIHDSNCICKIQFEIK